jgi:predicted permease
MNGAIRSLRILRRNWRLSAIAIFSLSVAMALGVVALSASDTSLLMPPAGADPGRLASIYLSSPGTPIDRLSYPDFEYYRQNNSTFSDIAALNEAITAIRVTYGADDKTPGSAASGGTDISAVYNPVSDNYFAVMGLRPLLGRFFIAGDGEGKTPAAVMTYTCWRRLGSDPNVVGKTVGQFTIVGVAPKEFTGSLFGINGDMVVAMSADTGPKARGNRNLFLLGRLKPGVSRQQAQANLAVLSRQLAAAYPNDDKDRTAVVTRATLLPPDAIPTTQVVAAVLMLLVLLVLLIACANVANLLLALAVGRRQEATIKRALGASRKRLVGEFLRESAMICAASSLLGYFLAAVVILRYSTVHVDMPMLGNYSIGVKLSLGATVVAATMALMFLTILATGLPAALYASSSNLSQVLSGEIVVGGTRKRMRRNALVVVQVAVCTLVLVGMGLCERSLYNLRHVNPGFTARNIVAEGLFLDDNNYSQKDGKAMYASLRTAVAAVPGVESVSFGGLPLFDGDTTVPVMLPGAEKQSISAASDATDGDYFATLGIPLVEGRVFSDADNASKTDVVIVNRQMAKMLWPDGDAVGHSILMGEKKSPAVVIGVVGDGKYGGLDEQPQPFFYTAFGQHYQGETNIVARTKGDPRMWLKPMGDAISSTGLQAALKPMTFQTVEDLSLLPERIVAGCVSALAALGLLLAVVGLFGAISYSVSERKKELGIRVALGARPWQLLRMILGQTLWVAGVGTVAGIALGVAATVLARSQFYGIAAVELSVLAPVAAAMIGISLAVAYFSARPWIKVDPMEAVRHA